MAGTILCILVGVISLVSADTLHTKGPLPRASASPLNVDPKLDCAIKELAWDFAKKLLPQQGEFMSAYDALQLEACNISLSSGRQYQPRPFLHQPTLKADAIEIYVDVSHGDDNNTGTIDKPLKTLAQAVKLSRFKAVKDQQKVIYMRSGVYYLMETIDLGPKDSNLMITGYKDEQVTISGGKLYQLSGIWKEIVNEMGPYELGINAIYGTVNASESNYQVKYFGNTTNYLECQTACEKNTSCYAYTWYDTTMSSFANMCYFRVDGLWVPRSEAGTISGKKLKILVADLSDQNPNSFTSLFINGRRAVRARYPGGNPETMGLHTNPTGYVSAAVKWLPPTPKPPAEEIHIQYPERNNTHFPEFQIGIGGPVAVFNPPESYWGTAHPIGGGARTYEITTGLVYSPDEEFARRTWKRPETGVVHAFHCGHWDNWQFAIDRRDNSTQEITWSIGGFQEARGCATGVEWYVENVFEELDSPGEWYFDDLDNKLYFYPNDSAPASGIGTVLDRVIGIHGSMDNPVRNVVLANLIFAHTATTFLKPYEVPSGGDWAIHRDGAVFVEGVDGFLLQNCRFDAPGGNGLFLSNYVRNAIIEGNEFVYTGDSAILSIGSTELIDGTDGNQPRGTKIIGNLMHEIGVFGKQTSAYCQAMTSETQVNGNVLFNGPRAGINFNDGFGGGHLVEQNLIFNMVRETGDHGSFNSWDRLPYVTTVRNGTPSLIQAQSNITRNFFINNYHSTWPIDHDDGSCYYYDTYNYLIYGGYKNYLGHSKTVKYNTYIYPDALHEMYEGNVGDFLHHYPFCATHDGASTTDLPSGWGEVWLNNTCVIGNPNVYQFGTCTPTGNNTGLIPFTANNTFYAPNEYIYITCGKEELLLFEFQSLGYDIGSEVYDPVDYDTIVDWGRKLLGL